MPVPTIFPVSADAADSLTERYAYLTNVLTARSGSEQRIQLRSKPRRSMEYSLAASDERQGALASHLIFGKQGASLGLPLWQFPCPLTSSTSIGAQSFPCVTAGVPFVVGEWMVAWRSWDSYEALTIDTVGGSAVTTVETAAKAWPAGTRVFPVQAGRLPASQSLSRVTSSLLAGAVKFDLEGGAAGPGALSLPTYQGFKVLTLGPNARSASDDRDDRRLSSLDSVTGALTTDAWDVAPAALRMFLWSALSRAAAAELRGFLDERKGRAIPFWYPSWSRDFTLVSPAASSATSLVVVSSGYTDHVFPLGDYRRHVQLLALGGTAQYRKVTAAVNNGNGTETLTVAALSEALTVNALCSQMRLCRLDSDEAELQWSSSEFVEATLGFRELPSEVPA